MEKPYVIAGGAYFYTFAAIAGAIGIIMIVIKMTLFKNIKNSIAENN